jgi:hypothetical protein
MFCRSRALSKSNIPAKSMCRSMIADPRCCTREAVKLIGDEKNRISRLNVDVEEQNMCDFDEVFGCYRKTNSDRRLLDVVWHVLPIVDIDEKGSHLDAFTDEHISRPFLNTISGVWHQIVRSLSRRDESASDMWRWWCLARGNSDQSDHRIFQRYSHIA